MYESCVQKRQRFLGVGLLYCGTSFVVRGGEGIEMDAEKDFDGKKLFLGEKGALSTTIYMMYCFYFLALHCKLVCNSVLRNIGTVRKLNWTF